MILKVFLLIGFVSICSVGFTQQEQPKITIRYKNENNVKAKAQSLDIYNSEPGKAKPVLVFVHGGGWLLGDKTTKIKRKVALFKKLGYVFVSVNYRHSSFFNKKIQYPVHVTDVADAMKWIWENIGAYGGDKNKVALMGHSAGAQMVSLLATSPTLLSQRGIEPKNIKGIISMDTEGYDVEGMCNAGANIYLKIFGKDPNAWKEASPMNHIKIGSQYPPFFIVMRGKPYRIEMAQKFADKLKSAGTPVTLISGEPYSHFKVNNIFGSAKDKTVTPKIIAFLKNILE